MAAVILIGADVFPTESNEDVFRREDRTALLGDELGSIWEKADLRIFNLEGPFTDSASPIYKAGPVLRAQEQSISGIRALRPDLVTLANNHIMDHGAPGYYHTIKLLQEQEIPYVGTGDCLQEAVRPYIMQTHGMAVGFYACAETEFSIAGERTPGANPFDSFESPAHIGELKKQCDYVIVLYHGGKEFYRYPSPYLRRVFRKMADCGADLVVAQHTHCIGCFEQYRTSTLVYGQGNFIFDNGDNEYWNSGLLLRITLEGKTAGTGYVPLRKKNGRIRLAEEDEGRRVLEGFYSRSAEILEEGTVEARYREYAESKISEYLCQLTGNSKPVRGVRKLLGDQWVQRLYINNQIHLLRNVVNCEAHRELLIEGLKCLEKKFENRASEF